VPVSGRTPEARAAHNEDLFRQINERLHTLADIHGSTEPRQQFICECEQTGCSLLVELTPAEYRSVRADTRHFLVFPEPAHTSPELEAVVERHDGYWVVEKRGEAGDEADYLADHGPKVL
jgi:hypothetical protein